ncbi:MAG: helix-hairpin-helix domain-containing protein [Cyclobacteriaceae bacterium]
MLSTKDITIKELRQIPGVGISIATDLWRIGITSIRDLKGKDPVILYDQSNQVAGCTQDRCLCMFSNARFTTPTLIPKNAIQIN